MTMIVQECTPERLKDLNLQVLIALVDLPENILVQDQVHRAIKDLLKELVTDHIEALAVTGALPQGLAL